MDQRIDNQERETDISHTTKLKKVVKAAKIEEAEKLALEAEQENKDFKESLVENGKKKREKKRSR